MPIEDNNDLDFDFEKGRYILAQGAELYVEAPEGTIIIIIIIIIIIMALLCSGMILNYSYLNF